MARARQIRRICPPGGWRRAHRALASALAGAGLLLAASAGAQPARQEEGDERPPFDAWDRPYELATAIPADFSPDLSGYVVTDPLAGYFDVDRRISLLEETTDPVLMEARAEYQLGVSCTEAQALPIPSGEIVIPRFHTDEAAWQMATLPLRNFETAVSDLAAAYVASGDGYYADCLLEMLTRWARAQAFSEFDYEAYSRQSWTSLQSSIAAAALAYTVIRPGLEDNGRTETVERWLHRLSRLHASYPGDFESCCNSHLYRRALHATAIGILTEDDELFQYGLRAVLLALRDLQADGALPRQVSRGARAIHYQNYALVYLIPTVALIERQGYRMWNRDRGNGTLALAARFLFDAVEDPGIVRRYSDSDQFLDFLEDGQYLAWMEIYLAHVGSERADDAAARRRPLYNRSAGGPTTLYFYRPNPAAETG